MAYVPVALMLAPQSSVSVRADFTGNVGAVDDSETLTAVIYHRQVKARLAEIELPDRGQPFGTRSGQSLADLCLSKDADVRETGRD